jgi:putative flippase GtrA
VFRFPDPRKATRGDWTQLLRFCVVGGSGYVVNILVYTGLLHLVDFHYLVAAVGAFVVAWTNNFVLNKYWTFKRSQLSVWSQALRYLTVSLAALGLNLAILYALVEADLNKVAAQALAIVLVTPVSFLLTRRWALL